MPRVQSFLPSRSGRHPRGCHRIVLTYVCILCHTHMMTVKRVTANLPAGLLEQAMETTGKGITETLTEGLELVRRTRAYRKALDLRGKIELEIDLEVSRERRPRR